MAQYPPTSVLLPTTEWTPAVEELAAQLGHDDELLVICDHPGDPIAGREPSFPDGVRLVVAGEPEGCSGKANAIAAGMDTASHDRIVWTDDDFDHPPDWLATLQADYDEYGPVSEVPFFVGRDALSTVLEPTYALGGTFGVYALDKAWAGAVVFERDDLDVDAFVAALRRTVSDDGLLSEYLDLTVRRRCRRVPVGGSIRATLERHVRFVQIVHRHEPRQTPVSAAVATLAAVGCLANPAAGIVLSTLLVGSVYALFGVRRWTVLLAYPATVCYPLLFAYALARRSFVWGGRRYRWAGKFDVQVVDSP